MQGPPVKSGEFALKSNPKWAYLSALKPQNARQVKNNGTARGAGASVTTLRRDDLQLPQSVPPPRKSEAEFWGKKVCPPINDSTINGGG